MARRESFDLEAFEEAMGPLAPFRDVPVPLSVELCRTKMTVDQLLGLTPGSILSLPKVDPKAWQVYAGDYRLLRGDVAQVEAGIGLRVTQIIDPREQR